MKTSSLSIRDYLKFIIPSLIGVFLFMIPITVGDKVTIPVALLAGWIQDLLGDGLPALATALLFLSVIGSLVAKFVKPGFIQRSEFLTNLFDVTPMWLTVRILGSLFAIMVFFKIGPDYIISEYTGHLVLFDLVALLFSIFLFAGLLLPLLLNFGLLELCGALLTKIMRPLFTLPGRSSIDCMASWMGDGTIGVLLTNKQYQEGFYTKREAAVIGTTFSVVSITFTITVLSYAGLEHLFLPYYLTIVVAGFVAALIMPRIPPLSRKKDEHAPGIEPQKEAEVPEGRNLLSWGTELAALRAQRTRFSEILTGGLKNVLDMWLGVVPVVMAFGTLALVVAENTPVFQWLGAPFVPLLTLMQVPEASAAAQSMVVGFADMLLPVLLAEGIQSELTLFVIACVSVTQLIYMSEVGGLLLGSKLPVNFKDLVLIFLLRTLITLPVIVLMAHLLL
ncbi:nucleoside recognition membrane protein YjiH [Desmospora profundinema]|uniref:Nucleoside recognition membrane protein YjiH n=1 Tax=Desmospora profundinema TaxID=1571184 RepID=A0ABU1IKD5_9BACL|nr:nucleoside recognition membrane protein YjiH [Desmospora profundinema]